MDGQDHPPPPEGGQQHQQLGVDQQQQQPFDMECSIYQNFSASEVFVQSLAGVVNQQDVEAMIMAQKKM